MRLNIGARSARSKAESVTAERLVNFYAEPTDGVSQIVVHGVPGLTVFTSPGNGPIRGMKKHAGALFVVSGSSLYKVSSNGSATAVGSIAGSGKVGMATSGTDLVITTGAPCAWLDNYFLFGPGIGFGYVYSGNTLTEISDPDFNAIANDNQWFISNVGDGAAYDALDFASAESNPDDLLRVFVDHREVLLFGGETVETWTNTGNNDFPFERVDGAISEKGLSSKWAVDQIDNTVFWLDQDGITRRMADGYNAQRLSTHEIEYQMSKGDITQAEAFAYVWQGHEFFVVTVPSAGTFIYDAATGLWHERESRDKGRWRACCFEDCYNKKLVGDFETGKVYYLDDSNQTEDGAVLVSEMVFPPIQNDGERFVLSEVQLDIVQGVGTDYTDEMDVMLRVSNDGVTWRAQDMRSAGPIGAREYRTIWRRLGQHKNLHLKFSISDAAKRAVYAAYAVING